jgi:transposase
MNNHKYVGLDVHQASISIAVHNHQGKRIAQAIIETKITTIRDFFKGLSGTIHATFEEGTQANWMYDILQPLVSELIVCNPIHNRLLAAGNKADAIDADKLAYLLRVGSLKSVYHAALSTRPLKELVHVYDCLVSDCTRVMNRIKAVFRSHAIRSAGRSVYLKADRDQWLAHFEQPALGMRLRLLYAELDSLDQLRRQARLAMLKEARQQPAYKKLIKVPALGPIRVAQIIATMGTPFRFRGKRQLWAYCGLAVVTRTSSDYEFVAGKLLRKQKPTQTRGLNHNYNRRLKQVFKSAALDAIRREPMKDYYAAMIEKKMRPEMARLTVARKIAAAVLVVWRGQEEYDETKLTKPSA